nr:helix-turn-helix transcriptional regulator [Burkholderia gladioli]
MSTDLPLRIKSSRAALGWTQTQLAEASGMPKAQLSRYESGRSNPRPEAIEKIAHALNVTYEWLATGDGSPERNDDNLPLPAGFHDMKVDLPKELGDQLRQIAATKNQTSEMVLLDILRRALQDPNSDLMNQLEDSQTVARPKRVKKTNPTK